MYTASLIIALLAFIIGLNLWLATVDAERNQAALVYEKCVQQEYHMTPTQWYYQHHVYPPCN